MGESRDLNLVQRAATWAASKLIPDWFGPNTPLTPVAPPAAVEGRQFDFDVGYNMQMTPRTESTALRSIRFSELRWLAESTEVLRAIIETRKDKICGLQWGYRLAGQPAQASAKDPRVEWVKKFMRKPDGNLCFDEWLRQLQEDVCVIDAPAIYVRRNGAGEVLAFEQIDGALIKPLMDEKGRIPDAPNAAYQGTFKGFSAIWYSKDDLIYRPRNPRIHTMYGFSPVEQIQVYANMAIRRQMQQLGYFTEGNMPEGMIPVSGTAEQVSKFQKIWDAGMIEGQKIGRIKFVPADSATKFQAFKDPVLADAFDEWMARISCYVFAEDPTPFIKSVNRATAEQADKSSQSTGLNVHVRYVKSLLDTMIQDYLGMEDVEAFVVPTEETDPTKATDRIIKLVAAGMISKDEGRQKEGFEGPAPQPEQPPATKDEAPIVPPAKESATRLSRSFDPSTTRANAIARQTEIADGAFAWLAHAASTGTDAILDQLTKVQRADGLDWVYDLDFNTPDLLRAIMPPLESIWQHSATIALGAEGPAKIGFKREASEWARERGAWLVGKSVDPITGEVRDASRDAYRVDDMCRKAIAQTFEAATRENWSQTKISETLMADHAFSRARSLAIAQTEIVNADESGKHGGWQAVGVPMEKKSLLASNENHGPDDIMNAAQGWIDLEREFQSGHLHPVYHVGCLCSTIARKKVGA